MLSCVTDRLNITTIYYAFLTSLIVIHFMAFVICRLFDLLYCLFFDLGIIKALNMERRRILSYFYYNIYHIKVFFIFVDKSL